MLAPGDVVALSGRRSTVMEIGSEPSVRRWTTRNCWTCPASVQTITVSNPAVIGKPLEELAQWKEARGVYLRRIKRIGAGNPGPAGHHPQSRRRSGTAGH